MDHLFVKSNFYGRLWSLISGCLGFSTTTNGSLMKHLLQFGSLGGYSKNVQVAFNIVCLSVVCVIWKVENRRIFQHKDDLLESLSENVKL